MGQRKIIYYSRPIRVEFSNTLTVQDDFGIARWIREVGFGRAATDRLLLVRVALGDVVRVSGMDAYDVFGAGHKADVKAPETICFFRSGADHQDHVVVHAAMAISPNRNCIVRDINLTVGNLVFCYGALGYENSLKLSGEVAGGMTCKS